MLCNHGFTLISNRRKIIFLNFFSSVEKRDFHQEIQLDDFTAPLPTAYCLRFLQLRGSSWITPLCGWHQISVCLSRIPAHKLKWCRKAACWVSDGHETYVQFLSDQHPEEKPRLSTLTLSISFNESTNIFRHSLSFGQLTKE
jgi:hypothetical protein